MAGAKSALLQAKVESAVAESFRTVAMLKGMSEAELLRYAVNLVLKEADDNLDSLRAELVRRQEAELARTKQPLLRADVD